MMNEAPVDPNDPEGKKRKRFSGNWSVEIPPE
jgi:hypothetical protein